MVVYTGEEIKPRWMLNKGVHQTNATTKRVLEYARAWNEWMYIHAQTCYAIIQAQESQVERTIVRLRVVCGCRCRAATQIFLWMSHGLVIPSFCRCRATQTLWAHQGVGASACKWSWYKCGPKQQQ